MPTQDTDERYTGKTVAVNGTTVDSEVVTYVKQGDHATGMPNQVTYPDTNISYTYDGNGNIIKIMQGGVLQAQYSYDTLGRLIREDNNALGKSYFYTYDNNGNITAKEYCAFTTGSHTLGTGTVTSYAYNKDYLTKVGIESCTYDKIGNPTTYCGKTAKWTRGRKLISYSGNTFSYDAQGRRISKNGIKYIYDSNGRLLKQTNGLEFFYDTTGMAGLKYNGTAYVYRKDVQGNIIAILDSSGNIVVQYKYDAWGYHTVSGSNTTLGNLNPFRYRSYYFDTETKLYYLKSRYYDPETGRFLNMDSIDYADPETINGLNLFAYCNNNPVMNVDTTGTSTQDFLSVFERIFSSLAYFCDSIVKYPKYFTVTLKQYHKAIPPASFRSYYRGNSSAMNATKSTGNILGKVANALAFTALAIDIGVTWYDNYKSGSATWVTDSIVDSAYIGAKFAIGCVITAVCSFIPVPGLNFLLGVGLSIGADYLLDWIVSETGVLNSIKSWAADVGEQIENGWNYFWSFSWI
ncbi:MAG: hypothetical protein K2L12_06615 [Clostridia bacterium]|nr:hypothetical protein [Clostridia bacterium]